MRILTLLILLGAFSAAVAQELPRGRYEEHTLSSEAIAGNQLGLSPERSVIVYLPPGYDDDEELEYPSVYFLHGIFGDNELLTGRVDPDLSIAPVLDDLIHRGAISPAIYVFPHAGVPIGGCFYTNSPVAGGWEDFIVQETVGLVDEHYRTLLDPASRGLVGHSMGGYGVLKIALRHSDVFGAVYAMSPAALDFGEDLTAENPAWKKALAVRSWQDVSRLREFFPLVFVCLAASLSPVPGRTELPFEWPYRLEADGALTLVEPVLLRWEAEMPLPMARHDASHLRRLSALRISVGQQEGFPHILAGCRRFSRVLQELDVPHEYVEYTGDHNDRIWQRFQSEVIPFFSRHLEAAVPAGAGR